MEFATDTQVAIVRDLATKLFNNVGQGHGADHMLRVEQMALHFSDSGRDQNLISLIALLHDADDYKLFPSSGDGQPNARQIMSRAEISEQVAERIIREIARLGYSKRLAGVKAITPEGMAVSDADMCDAMGATGVMRIIEYDLARGIPLFDREDFPNKHMTVASYTTCKCGMVRHMFEKILRLPDMMLTTAGKAEALQRKELNVIFLRELFREQDAPEWANLLGELS